MDQLRALRDGKLHVTGVNTGAVPLAVNACGFVPFCGFGNDSGLVSYTMRIVVAAENEISAVAGLAGRTLTLTTPTSNSGWKAPLMILKRDFNLLPVRDFAVNFSNGHAESLQGIASGQYEIAAVASDEIDLAVERGVIDKGSLRTIYESARFPSNVLGRAYNLSPEVSEKVRAAFLSYDWTDTAIQREFSAFGARRFAPIAYEADLRLVREIDDAMGRRHIIGDTLPGFDDDRSADRVKVSKQEAE